MYSFLSVPFLLHSAHYRVMDVWHGCRGAGARRGERPRKGLARLAQGWPNAACAGRAPADAAEPPPGHTARTSRRQSRSGLPSLPMGSFQNFPGNVQALLCSASCSPRDGAPHPADPVTGPVRSVRPITNLPRARGGAGLPRSPCNPPEPVPRGARPQLRSDRCAVYMQCNIFLLAEET